MSRERRARVSKKPRSDMSLRAHAADESLLMAPPSSGGDIRIHLVYPNRYWVAMSNLGFQAVYGILAKLAGVVVERAFLPEGDLSGPIKTFESGRPLADCDVLGFSLSFETDYPHVVSMLRHIKLLSLDPEERNRLADQSRFGRPLLLAGGTGVTLNPEPVADFFDSIFLGEAEEFLPELVSVLRRARESNSGRREVLLRMSDLEGVYVPQFFVPVYGDRDEIVKFEGQAPRARRRFVKDLSKYPTHSIILTPNTEFRSMFLTETGRGCEMGCRFCVAGYIYRPVRKRSEESIAETVKIGLENSEAVGFVGAAVSSHRAIAKLATHVAERGGRASLSSIMSQKVSPELAASLSESEYKTVALAPEAGSERLRRAAGKRVSNEQVIEAARTLAEAGIKGFKLYFMVGLPTERDEDVEAIVELAEGVQAAVLQASRPSGKAGWIILSVNPFIPKASTPFQWEPMLERRDLERKIDFLRGRVKRIPNVEMNYESPRESYFQAFLSRGDRRVARVLIEMAANRRDWKWLVSKARQRVLNDVPALSFYATRRIPFGEILPWEMVDSRIDRALLMREARRAYEDRGAVVVAPPLVGPASMCA